MFYRMIAKYGLATHLAVLTAVPTVASLFLSARALGVLVLWLSALAALWLFAAPSIRAGEHLSRARTRVYSEIMRSPLFWFFLTAVAFAAVRWLNSGIALFYDAEQTAWLVRDPAVSVLPASCGDAGFLPIAITVAAMVLVLGIRFALGLSARISYGLTTAFLTGAGGLAASGCVCAGLEPFVKVAAADLSASGVAGAMFGVWLVVAVACGVHAEARQWRASRLPFCLAIAGNTAGLLFFAPPLVSCFFGLFAALCGIFSFFYLGRIGSSGAVARYAALFLLGVALPIFLLVSLAPENVRVLKLHGLDFDVAMGTAYRESSAALTRVSKAMWISRPWGGVGIGAFRLHVPFLAEKADWTVLPTESVRAVNSFWTLLAERGIVGCAWLAVGILLLSIGYVRRLTESFVFLRRRDDADLFLFACPPLVWFAPFLLILLAVTAVFTAVLSDSVIVFSVVAPFVLATATFPRAPVSPDVSTQKEN